MSKKAYCNYKNYKASKTGTHYNFKIRTSSFNGIFISQIKLLAEHRDAFFATKNLAIKTLSSNFFLRVGELFSGGLLKESNDFFQKLYKDVRPKEFAVSAKFSRVKILF